MSITYTKLLSSITESTVWCEPDSTRLVWITMLAMADRSGRVWASIPGLASRARVPIDACREAIRCFLSPDPDSRTKDHEGRRIEEIDGGWRLINHAKYRELRDLEERQAYQREWIANKRHQQKLSVDDVDKVDQSLPQSTYAEASSSSSSSSDPEKETDTSTGAVDPPPPKSKRKSRTKSSAVPMSEFHEAVVTLYRELCPMLPQIQVWTRRRQELLEARIQERCAAGKPADTAQYWRGFFENVAASDFLSGRETKWHADFQWLLEPEPFLKVIEGKYKNNGKGNHP
jgi:hypothetical protein